MVEVLCKSNEERAAEEKRTSKIQAKRNVTRSRGHTHRRLKWSPVVSPERTRTACKEWQPQQWQPTRCFVLRSPLTYPLIMQLLGVTQKKVMENLNIVNQNAEVSWKLKMANRVNGRHYTVYVQKHSNCDASKYTVCCSYCSCLHNWCLRHVWHT